MAGRQPTQKRTGLQNADPFVVQVIVGVVGILAAAVMTWMMTKSAATRNPAARLPEAAALREAEEEVTDMDELLAEAEARLAVAQQEKDSKIGKLPAILLMGEVGSAKTTTMVQSGAEPESLAGQVYEDNNILPTPRGQFLVRAPHRVPVEMGGKLLGDTDAWKSLISRSAALRKPRNCWAPPKQVPRAALVCVDAETCLDSPSPDPMATLARKRCAGNWLKSRNSWASICRCMSSSRAAIVCSSSPNISAS